LDKKLIISDIKVSHDRHRELKRLLNKERNKLGVLYKKYRFIDEIVNPSVDDIELQKFIADLFRELGYLTKQPKETADFDVIIKYNDDKIGIEVKNGRHVGENELFQAKKYASRHKTDEDMVLHPLVIWNNTKKNIDFDNNRTKDAIANDYGIMTTQDLLNGYLGVKSGKISFDFFHKNILKRGHIKFSNKQIRVSESEQGVA
jgi:hypothetical protein